MTATVIYVSNADSAEISVLALDETSGALSTLQTLPCGGTVMPLALSPDRRTLYAGIRSEPWRVLALRVDAQDGRLQPLAEAPLPQGMAHLAVDRSGRWLFGASYHGNLVTVSPLEGSAGLGPARQTLPTAPKTHALRSTPDGRHAIAAVLGGHLLMQFCFDAASGTLTPNVPPVQPVRDGAGPRHLCFSVDGRFVYLLNELDASVDVFALEAARGTLSPVQTVSMLPPGFTGEPWAAELRLTPDGRRLYTSERRSSTLAGFDIDAASGTLRPIGHWPTQAQPRGFAITPSGRWLIAAGQLSHQVGVHRIDPASGALSLRNEHAVGRNPNWVEAITLP